jgi:hypothetical protein
MPHVTIISEIINKFISENVSQLDLEFLLMFGLCILKKLSNCILMISRMLLHYPPPHQMDCASMFESFPSVKEQLFNFLYT